MKILVTGGSGFIGLHMVKELHQRGAEIVSFDIIPPPERLPGVYYVTGTVLDKDAMRIHLKGCDALFHLAAMIGVKRSDTQLLKCMTVNIQGTVNALEACVMSNTPNILLTSSSEVFGDVTRDQVDELSPFNPKSGYAVTKLAGEHYVRGFHKEFGLNYNIVRFFNVYGPGQVAEFVVPRFVNMVQEGQAPSIYGDGSQVRSFCHIHDARRAVMDIFECPEARNETYNVGNDNEPVTMLQLARRVLRILKSDLKPKMVPFSESDRESTREIYYRVPDISKLKQAVDYEARVSLDEGLRQVVESSDIPQSWKEPVTIGVQ